MRYVLAPLRAVALLLHVLGGILIALTCFHALDQPRRNRVIGAWSRGLLRVCNRRPNVSGLN